MSSFDLFLCLVSSTITMKDWMGICFWDFIFTLTLDYLTVERFLYWKSYSLRSLEVFPYCLACNVNVSKFDLHIVFCLTFGEIWTLSLDFNISGILNVLWALVHCYCIIASCSFFMGYNIYDLFRGVNHSLFFCFCFFFSWFLWLFYLFWSLVRGFLRICVILRSFFIIKRKFQR